MKCIPVLILCVAAVFAQIHRTAPESVRRKVPAHAADASAPFTFTTGQAARLTVGQETFTSQDTNSSDTVLGSASGIAVAGDTLFVADSNRVGASPSNNRVLLFSNLSSQLPAPTAELAYNSKCPVCVGQANVVLGQPDFVTTTQNDAATNNSLRTPTGIASDGVHLVVADTDHNRVLIWNHIPTNNNTGADVVVGQPDFVSVSLPGNTPSAKSMRGPEGVWLQNGKLFVADTQNNRVLIFNHIPTTNGVAADVVVGAPNFTTYVNPDISQGQTGASGSTMLSPVSVKSDGTRLVVADLGFNRVLIFNSIPTSNGVAADVALGQPDLVSSLANNAYTGTAASSSTDTTNKEVPLLCTVSNGVDPYGNKTYPNGCNATLNFPRDALFANGKLVVADGGNDRVLIWEQIPTQNGINLADTILGQIGGDVNQASDAADSLRTPTSLAWDGANLYVSDTYNRRVNVYTIEATTVGYQGVRNAASMDIIAHGSLTVSGTIQAGDVVTITINTATYTYTVLKTDTLETVVTGIVNAINSANSGAGDQYVVAVADATTTVVLLNSRQPGDIGNNVTYSVTYAPATGVTAADIVVTAANSSLTGGGDAANVAPGTVVAILGTNLSAGTASADATKTLPTKLGGTEVYFNGIQVPLFSVSPTQINAQMPWEVGDTTSVNAYVRSEMPDGTIMVTAAVAVSIVPANPGLYFQPGTSDPTQAIIYHGSSNATAIVSVDGGVAPDAVATVTVNGRSYSYTATVFDTLDTIRNGLAVLLNTDPQVSAGVAGVFDRIILKARVAGPEGNGIPITGNATGGSLVITAFDDATCCGNVGGAPITVTNPAVPGEFVVLYATGLGLPVLTDAVQPLVQTGVPYGLNGPPTVPQEFVSATAGGSTADVLQATMLPGSVGNYQVLLHLNPGLVSNQNTLLNIAQDTFISNNVAFPVVSPSGITSQDPVLLITSTHSGNFNQGQTGASYTITVTNTGTGNPTQGQVTVTDTIPAGLTLISMTGDGWNCNANICTRSDGLAAGTAWPTITVIVNVASNAAASITNTVKITGGGSASSTSNDVTIVNTASGGTNSTALLSVVKKHNGNFSKGQNNATYTITVSNASGVAGTSGAVTVTDAVPIGLTLVSMAGTGWTCSGDTCNRTDSLGSGKSYPAITVTVNVATNAAASVINQAILSGGNSPASVVSDMTIIN